MCRAKVSDHSTASVAASTIAEDLADRDVATRADWLVQGLRPPAFPGQHGFANFGCAQQHSLSEFLDRGMPTQLVGQFAVHAGQPKPSFLHRSRSSDQMGGVAQVSQHLPAHRRYRKGAKRHPKCRVISVSGFDQAQCRNLMQIVRLGAEAAVPLGDGVCERKVEFDGSVQRLLPLGWSTELGSCEKARRDSVSVVFGSVRQQGSEHKSSSTDAVGTLLNRFFDDTSSSPARNRASGWGAGLLSTGVRRPAGDYAERNMDGALIPTADPAVLFSRLAHLVYQADTSTQVYQALVKAARDLVTGCDRACIMLLAQGRLSTAAATDDIALIIDQLEQEAGEGPCVDAIFEEAAQVEPDIRTSQAWPTLTPLVLQRTPVRGMIGFRLLIDGAKAGALNLFSDTPGAFTSESADQGAVVAAFVSVALMTFTARQEAEQLRAGLSSNREIGKAVGLLMAAHKVDAKAAFEVLRKTSQDLNLKLSTVAEQVVSGMDAQLRRGSQ